MYASEASCKADTAAPWKRNPCVLFCADKRCAISFTSLANGSLGMSSLVASGPAWYLRISRKAFTLGLCRFLLFLFCVFRGAGLL